MADFDPAYAGTWIIDPAHSRFGFAVKHAMVSKVRGGFHDVKGTVTVGEGGASDAHVEITVQAASVNTGNEQRDAHLRTGDFFEAEKYPEIRFVSTGIDEVGDDAYIVLGDLTIKETTKHVSIPLELTGIGRDDDGNLRAGFEGTRRIDRRDFGLEWQVPLDAGGVLVSERITLEFELSLIHVEDDAQTES